MKGHFLIPELWCSVSKIYFVFIYKVMSLYSNTKDSPQLCATVQDHRYNILVTSTAGGWRGGGLYFVVYGLD